MKTSAALLCSAFTVFFLVAKTPCSSSSDVCIPSSCDDVLGPEIKFPFKITGRQPERCGYPGFNVSCDDQGKTIITLPSTPGSFVVNNIDYASQTIHISDPENCLPERILNLSLAASPFRARDDVRYTIMSLPPKFTVKYAFLFPCHGNISKSVTAVPYSVLLPALAVFIVAENVSIPMSVNMDDPVFWGFVNRLELSWDMPECRDCGSRDKLCGFSTDKGSEITCSDPPHYSKGNSIPHTFNFISSMNRSK